MRTHLSALPVQDLVRELVIAHAKPGLHKVYDQHAYQAEKRECLELWERRLLAIVEPHIPADDIPAVTNPVLKYVTLAGFRCLRQHGDQTRFSHAGPGDAGGVAPYRGGDGESGQDAG
jgi:hypothetical protein